MSDYNFLMESRLSPEQFQTLGHISRAAAEQGLNLYLVGGAVRDLTYGQQTVSDLDFSVEGDAEKILRRLQSGPSGKAGRRARQGAGGAAAAPQVEALIFTRRLNSAEIRFSNGVRAEISMARSEFYPKPGRRPETAPAMIFEDLKRRDFSVNAMAVSLHPNSRGLLLDPTNGVADIERHELRVLNSRSFSEDSSRIYRLHRLGRRLGFKPEERTQNYLQAALVNRGWRGLEPETQGRELRAILQEENPAAMLKMLAERDMLEGLDRKLGSVKIPSERFGRIRQVARSVPGADPFLLNFYCLTEKLPSSQRSRLARKIIVHRKTIQEALGLERNARKLAKALASSKNALPSRVDKLLSGQPKTLLEFLLVYYPQAKIQYRVKNFLHKFPLVRARLPRAEFQAMGMKPGPKFEKILEEIYLEQLDGKIKTHQQTLKRLRDLSGIKETPPKPAKRGARPKGREQRPSPQLQKKALARAPAKKARPKPKPKRPKRR